MSGLKKLGSETLWYGGSSIAAKFINYLLTPFLTYNLAQKSDYGKMGLIYALIPIFNVLFTYGFETAYFRFSAKNEDNKKLYSTAFLSLFFSTIILIVTLWFFRDSLGQIIGLADYPTIIKLMIFVIATDTLTAIPFARLRQENKPRKFALAKIIGILVNIFLTWFFIGYCPAHYAANKAGWVSNVYDPNINQITYVVLANLIQSLVTLLFLYKEIVQVRLNFDKALWLKMIAYAMPLILVGLGGMINETMDRLMLRWWQPGTEIFKEEQVGVYNACYKLAILITLFIQAFKMSAEPFFFKQAEGINPQKTYARVMKFFVIIISIMFLAVSLFIPIWKYFIDPRYWDGLVVVPILLLANIFLGIYYNLSVWYKLSNKTIYGAWITLIGAGITIIINYLFIKNFGFIACAWATFFCYGSMMVISFLWGQKHYHIPYAWKKLVAYLVIVVCIFLIDTLFIHFVSNKYVGFAVAIFLIASYCRFLTIVEHKEFSKLPIVGKYFIQKPKK